jgi:hypothetical protein
MDAGQAEHDAGVDAGSEGLDAGAERDAGAETMDAGRSDAGRPDAGRRDASVSRPDAASGVCATNTDCGSAEYCHRPVGQCLGPGVCTLLPEDCVAIFAPTCGCDWRTYDSPCQARSAGVAIRSAGACELPDSEDWCSRTPSAPDLEECNRCFDDADCGGLLPYCVSSICAEGGEGICALGPPPEGDCYTSLECGDGEFCSGSVLDICLPEQGSCAALPTTVGVPTP